jgi:hypothetical protein
MSLLQVTLQRLLARKDERKAAIQANKIAMKQKNLNEDTLVLDAFSENITETPEGVVLLPEGTTWSAHILRSMLTNAHKISLELLQKEQK